MNMDLTILIIIFQLNWGITIYNLDEHGPHYFNNYISAELGDYNPDEHGPHYLSEFRFIPNQTDKMLREVEALHKKHRSVSFS